MVYHIPVPQKDYHSKRKRGLTSALKVTVLVIHIVIYLCSSVFCLIGHFGNNLNQSEDTFIVYFQVSYIIMSDVMNV